MNKLRLCVNIMLLFCLFVWLVDGAPWDFFSVLFKKGIERTLRYMTTEYSRCIDLWLPLQGRL